MMNSSNALSNAIPERIDLSRQTGDARIEGGLGDLHIPGGLASKTNKDGPVKELTAASALTSLVKPPADLNNTLLRHDPTHEDFEIPQRFTKSGRKKAVPFPMKLMKVLSAPENTSVITWLPDGKSFTIVRPKAFVATILPKEFKSAKYSSFTRKLHRWGFQRHLRGEEAGAFFHKMFQRGRLDLVEKMTCYKPGNEGKPSPLSAAAAMGGFRGAGGGGPGSFRPDMRHHASNARAALIMQQQQHQQQQQQHHQQQSGGGPGLVGNLGGNHMMNPNLMRMQAESELRQQMNLPSASAMKQGGGGEQVDRLNAAIELEVNRRLNERITAATISRQALAYMGGGMGNDGRGGGGGYPQTNMSSSGGPQLGGGGGGPSLNVMADGPQHAQPAQHSQQQNMLQELQRQHAELQEQQRRLQQGMPWGSSAYGGGQNQGM